MSTEDDESKLLIDDEIDPFPPSTRDDRELSSPGFDVEAEEAAAPSRSSSESSASSTLEAFDWAAYLGEVGGVPVPPEALCQPTEIPENPLEEEMLLEALDDRSGGSALSYASVQSVHGIFVKVRLVGCDSSNDRWIVCYDPELAHFGHSLEVLAREPPPPIAYRSTSQHYSRFLDKVRADEKRPRLTKEALQKARVGGTVPSGRVWAIYDGNQVWTSECETLDDITQATLATSASPGLLSVGMKLEAVDPRNFTGGFHPATIVGLSGDSVEVHFDGWRQHNMMCKADSRFLFPTGWAERAGMECILPPRKDGAVIIDRRTKLVKEATGTDEAKPEGTKRQRKAARTAKDQLKAQEEAKKSRRSTPTRRGRQPRKADPPDPEIKLPSISPRSDKSGPSGEGGSIFERIVADTRAPEPESRPLGELLRVETEPTPRARKTIPSGKEGSATRETSPSTMRLFVNQCCAAGPSLDPQLLQANTRREIGPGSAGVVTQRGLSQLLDCALPEAAMKLLDAVPGPKDGDKGLLSVSGDAGGALLTRPLRTVATAAEGQVVISDFLRQIGACPSLLSVSPRACPKCGVGAPAQPHKRPREEDEGAGVESWGVERVATFIGANAGDEASADLSPIFRSNAIDGKALLLLCPELMMRHMGLRLGPALKVTSLIQKLRRGESV